MLEIKEYGEITQIKMSRELNGKPVYWVSAYLVDGLLIDTGSEHTSDELAEFLKTHDVKVAVNTHYHEDHIGANRKLQNILGVQVYAHRDSIPLIATRPHLYPYQEVAFGYPEPSVVKPLADIIKTANHEFRIIETPGHCVGHVVLIEMPEGWCFSGDIFAREKIKFIRPEENIAEQIESMKMLLSLPVEKLVLFTAMGRVIGDGKRALSECVEYLKEMEMSVKRLAGEGRSAEDIVTELFGGENVFSQLTNGQFSTMNLVRSLLEIK